jgi:hypothetical protein
MNAVLRIGSMLMILFLSASIVCGSCSPVTQTPPCHGPQHDDGATCYAAQQPAAATRVVAATPGINQDYIAIVPEATVLAVGRRVSETTAPAPLPSNDIYLRTRSLLI